MSMLGKSKNSIKKAGMSWITIWFIIAALVFSGAVVYAAYTGVVMVKRVVSTRAGIGILFSSNYMDTNTLMSIEYGDYADYPDSNPVFQMNVSNYSQGDKSSWYVSKDIEYTITAELLLNERYSAEEAQALGNAALEGKYKTPSSADLAGKQFGIKYAGEIEYHYFSDGNTTIRLPGSGEYSLSNHEASSDEFMILIDKSELQNIVPSFWIKLTATPKTEIGGEVETISGYLGLCKNATGEANWAGMISDADYATKDYDAYNYSISGNGVGTFYFAWDDDKVHPNEFGLMNYGSDTEPLTVAPVDSWTGYNQYGNADPASETGDDTWKYLTIKVNSAQLARYVFQLYKTSGSNYGADILKYVDYKFETE